MDAASLTLIAAGGLCYALAFAGMQTLRLAPHDPAAPLFAGYTRYVRLTQLSYLGLAVVVAGISLALYAAFDARRTRGAANEAAGV